MRSLLSASTEQPAIEWMLKRTYHPKGTNGVLLRHGVPLCATIELPWKNNRPAVSCIPEGKYLLVQRSSLRMGRHLLVSSVPGRRFILLHPANNALLELKGCIAPVTTHTGPGKGIGSRKAMQVLLQEAATVWESQNKLYLRILSVTPEPGPSNF